MKHVGLGKADRYIILLLVIALSFFLHPWLCWYQFWVIDATVTFYSEVKIFKKNIFYVSEILTICVESYTIIHNTSNAVSVKGIVLLL